MSDQAVLLWKWSPVPRIILAKYQLGHILFELCLFWYLAQSKQLWDTLYVHLNQDQSYFNSKLTAISKIISKGILKTFWSVLQILGPCLIKKTYSLWGLQSLLELLLICLMSCMANCYWVEFCWIIWNGFNFDVCTFCFNSVS